MAELLIVWTDEFGNKVNLDTVISARVTRQKDAKSNSLELTLPREGNILDGEPRMKTGETFTVYMSQGIINRTNPSNDDLLGSFKILRSNLNSNAAVFTFTCSDSTFELLSNLYTRAIDEDTLNSKQVIENIVQTVAEDGVDQTNVTVNMDLTKSDSSPFPLIGAYSSLYKSGYDAITELSQPQFTGDDQTYNFWFDPDGTFQWHYPSVSLEPVEFEYGKEPVIDFKVKNDESEIINFVIFECGVDKNGAAILDKYLRPDAGTIKGTTVYKPYTDISKNLKQALENQGLYAGISNSDFIDLCVAEGTARAKALTSQIGGKPEVTVNLRGNKYTMANNHACKSPLFPKKTMRIERIVDKFDRSGWETMITLKEDESAEV